LTCPEGMAYQQCGPVCPQTCDTNEDIDCNGGCNEGCFCPDGEVFYNGNCIRRADCPGMISCGDQINVLHFLKGLNIFKQF